MIGALAATATLPGEPASAVVALHGADGGTREHHLLRRLHDLIPAVTFDRRGEGGSGGVPSVGDFEKQADDAAAVADWLREQPNVTEVGCWGFSQGAWVGAIALSRARFDFLVLIGSCAVAPYEQMRFGVSMHLRRAGFSDDDVAEAMRVRRLVEAQAHGDATADEVGRELTAARAASWWEPAYLPERALTPDECTEWIREMDFDPVPSIAAVNVPTLLVYGTDDLWLPVETSIDAWRQHHPDVDVLTIQGASHDLIVNGRVAQTYEDHLVNWVLRPPGRLGDGCGEADAFASRFAT